MAVPVFTLLLAAWMVLPCGDAVMGADVLAGRGTEAVRGRFLSCLVGDPPERHEPQRRPHYPSLFWGPLPVLPAHPGFTTLQGSPESTDL